MTVFTIDRIAVGAWRAVCYALTNTGGTLLIDPGAQPDLLLRWLAGARVIGIVLTHCHCDHIGAVNELVDAHGCWVACGADDVDGVADVHRSGFDEEGVDYTVDRIDRPLGEGDVVAWGEDSLRVLHTPGHTPGSICLLSESQRTLFSGDTLFAGAVGSTAFVMGDTADMRRSCARLSQLRTDLAVLPGHGRPTTLAQERPMLRSIAGPQLGGGDQALNWREGSWW
ncbi:MBL fold metallo-hydrolase [Actinomyces sp. B33]|uniref:MBL fold metallo-hydrolase n=1 Tax=Actinomyces sp. B33 TaxID=2942131 RepID=UPI0023422239|nr:MBL fold metallo-hydrolase [Actinomyces sp. B33]MDC4233040.1 MBL fold metallo-hydrolase [Actinomyces sp. B33]